MKLINGWTKEKVMEQVKKYNNGKKCMDNWAPIICSYLNENGNRCLVGCFIPDNHPGLKSQAPVCNLLNKYPDLRDKMPFEDMSRFQKVHDYSRESVDNIHSLVADFLGMWVE